MTQKNAANCLEINRYKMTQLRNGRLNSFTVDDLGFLMKKLEKQIQLYSSVGKGRGTKYIRELSD